MKKLFILGGMLLGTVCLWAQTPIVRMVYIDNSRPKAEAVINDNMITRITNSIDESQGRKDKLVLFMSNGSNFSITDYYPSVEKMLDKLYVANTKEPDQYYDVKKLRDMLYAKAAGYKGKMVFDFYINGSFCGAIPDKAAPLFAFLPREIASISNDISIEVNIYYPATYKLVDIYKIKSALEFYDQGQFASNVEFNVTPL